MNKFAHLLLPESTRLLKVKTVLRLVDSLINFSQPSFLYQKLDFHNFEPIMMSMSNDKKLLIFSSYFIFYTLFLWTPNLIHLKMMC